MPDQRVPGARRARHRSRVRPARAPMMPTPRRPSRVMPLLTAIRRPWRRVGRELRRQRAPPARRRIRAGLRVAAGARHPRPSVGAIADAARTAPRATSSNSRSALVAVDRRELRAHRPRDDVAARRCHAQHPVDRTLVQREALQAGERQDGELAPDDRPAAAAARRR